MKEKLTSALASDSRRVRSLRQRKALVSAIGIAAIVWTTHLLAQADPPASWNDTASKKSIIAFVEKVTKEGLSDYVKPEERIATFDNDGTLWVKQPNYTQVTFAIDEVIANAPRHPEWRETEPFKSILAHGSEGLTQERKP
jgi:hypothetical protein